MSTLKIKTLSILATTLLGSSLAWSQNQPVILAGERIAEPLVSQWIRDYLSLHPQAAIQFDHKAKDPVLRIEFTVPEESHPEWDHFSIARLAILPIANVNSPIASKYEKKGLDEKQIRALYFDDIYTEKDDVFDGLPYQVYTRLGASGIPLIFSASYGFEPHQLQGKAIAGNDFHVVQAVQKDPQAVTFSTSSLIFDSSTRQLKENLVVLPIDLDGNGRITEEEHIYENLDLLVNALQQLEPKAIDQLPIAHLRISVNFKNADKETLDFLKWILDEGQQSLAREGFLQPDRELLERERRKLDRIAYNQ